MVGRMTVWRVYLDTSAWFRPFDDLTIGRNHREARAVVTCLRLAESGLVEIACSPMLQYEVRQTPHPVPRQLVLQLLAVCTVEILYNERVQQHAQGLVTIVGLRPRDSLHLAFAAEADALYFVTTDDQLIRRAQDIVHTLGKSMFIIAPDRVLEEWNRDHS